MKLKDINIYNLKSFLQGNFYYYVEKLGIYPDYKREQILYRLDQCKNDCVPNGKCKECGCPTKKKVFASTSCNKGKRFPDLMNQEDWEEFKKKNNLS